MEELMRSNDAVLISYIRALLAAEGIEIQIFDSGASFLEGSIGAFPRRIMVPSGRRDEAAMILHAAGIELGKSA